MKADQGANGQRRSGAIKDEDAPALAEQAAGRWSDWKKTKHVLSHKTAGEGRPFWHVVEGDSRALLPELPEASVNCVVTSPPYYWQRDYNVEGQIGLEDSVQGYVDNIRGVFAGLKHVLHPTGTIFLNIGDTYYSGKGQPHGDDEKHRGRRFGLRAVDSSALGLPRKTQIGIPWRVALALIDDGWVLRSSIVWVRRSAMPEPTARDRPWRQYEMVFLFARSRHYYFNRDAVAEEEDVWNIEPERNSISRGIHYAPFPRELVLRCLEAGCPPGGVVLDPFMGGGTTLFAALESGRNGIGIDLQPEFCDYVADKMAQLQNTRIDNYV